MCKTMVTGKRGTVKRHPRISKIMPLTESQQALMLWLLGRLWSGNDPQCARRWRSSEQTVQPYEPHDMELAQDDFDRYGFQYVRPGEGFSYRGEE